MKKRELVVALLAFFVFMSCSNDELNVKQSKEEERVAVPITQAATNLTEEEAKLILNGFLTGSDQLKNSMNNFEIIECKKKNISDYVKNESLNVSQRTISNSSVLVDTIPIYEFTTSSNGDKGFALVVGNSLYDEVIAYSPKGSLADTAYNDGLALFMSSIPTILSSGIEQKAQSEIATRADYFQPDGAFFLEPDSEKHIIRAYSEEEFNKYYDYYTRYGAWDEFDTPCRFVPVKWHQDVPYNDNVELMCSGKRAKIGCVPVAIAQLMAYHKKPSTYNWSVLTALEQILPTSANYKNGRCKEVARLMTNIANNAGTIYGCKDDGGSKGSTSPFDIPWTLNALGYSVDFGESSGKIKSDIIYQNLVANMPILVLANRTELHGVLQPSVGHIWVVDGLCRKWRDYFYYSHTYYWENGKYIDYYDVYKARQRSTHIHCNWGWGGSSDGWYHIMQPVNDGYSFTEFRMLTQIKYKG